MSRDDALEWARAARAARHEVRERLGSGADTLRQVLDRARTDELVGAVRLGWALESLPGARKIDTRRRLAVLGIDPAAQLSGLDEATRHTVADAFSAPDGSVDPAGAPSGDAPAAAAAAMPAPAPSTPAGDDAGDDAGEGVASEVPPLPEGSSVVVISGPGGVGKGTIVTELLRRDARLWLSRSWTTRARRVGESPEAYHFASPEEFRRRARDGGFLEWTTFLDYHQGSPVPEPPEGHDVLFEIDVRGAANIRRLYPDALLVFVDAPDRATQEERLRGRGDDEDRVRQRLAKAAEEVERAAGMDFVHVVNDDLERTVDEVEALIAAHRSR